jgi:cadmium resistance protein CadD (predicted permease)
MIPVPFTVVSLMLLVACFISKLQYKSSHLIIALHAILGPFETATLAYAFVSYLQYGQTEFITRLLLIIPLTLIGILNLLALAAQTPTLTEDGHFSKWLKRRENKEDTRFNYCWFYFISILSFLSNYKLKMLLFSGLFNFECLKCKL